MKLEIISATLAGYLAAFGILERPQNPNDRNYIIEHHRLPGGSLGVVLDAELTLPKGSHIVPGVVLITGSGPQNKNEELAGHKPFLVLSDHLTKDGFAVLRYDDRGVGKSTGNFSTATPFELAADAAAAMTFLKSHPKVKHDKTGYVGHSEGGYLAPIAQNYSSASFLVLLAAPALPLLPDVMATQVADVSRAEGATEDQIVRQLRAVDEVTSLLRSSETIEEIRTELTHVFKNAGANRSQIKDNIALWATPWAIAYAHHDPMPYLKALDVPVLGLFAEYDLQVSALENAPEMEAGLKDPRSEVVVLPGLNHLFQPTETGRVSEYVRISTTIDPTALGAISNWITETTVD